MSYQIVLVPFPFDDFSATKLRPTLCLTGVIGSYRHIVCAFITSNISYTPDVDEINLLKDDDDFAMTGLKVNSSILLHRLITIPEDLII